MLSYQHLYHAGNQADIHKHAMLSGLLATLTQKERPITYMETHAGRGLYDLSSPEAHKTGEAASGISQWLKAPTLPVTHPYRQTLNAIQTAHGLTAYPGSPAIARHLLRSTDQLHLFELHPQEVQHLKRQMKGTNIHIHHRDGYEGVLAISPPTPLRGLVLVDPSYEIKNEYEQVVPFLATLHQRWPQACLALWYPMLKAGLHLAMVEALLAHSWPVQHYPHQIADPETVRGMYGSGMILINAPYGFVWDKNVLAKTHENDYQSHT